MARQYFIHVNAGCVNKQLFSPGDLNVANMCVSVLFVLKFRPSEMRLWFVDLWYIDHNNDNTVMETRLTVFPY